MMDKEKKNIHAGHRKRLRNQVIYASNLSFVAEHNVLETLLSFSIARKDVNPLSHELLETFGSLNNVLNAPKDKLLQIKGLGEVAVDHIKFCSMLPEFLKLNRKKTSSHIRTSNDALNFLQNNVEVTDTEKFYYVLMDNNGKVLCFRCLTGGTIDKLFVDLRMLISQITAMPTSSVVICHTHPHGDPNPSKQDLDFTAKLESLLKEIGILLCDHIILTFDDYYSFYRNGKVRRDESKFAKQFDSIKLSIDDAKYLDEI